MKIEILQILITIPIAIIGWIIGHYFTMKRDIANKRRELRLANLIDAYILLACDIAHRPPNKENKKQLEDLIAKLHLFGTKTQIELINKMCDDICNSGHFELDKLINLLKNDIRKNINLGEIKENVRWLRLNDMKSS